MKTNKKIIEELKSEDWCFNQSKEALVNRTIDYVKVETKQDEIKFLEDIEDGYKRGFSDSFPDTIRILIKERLQELNK